MRAGNIVSIAALSLAALMFAPQIASAERVCTRTYHDGVMRERCVNREPKLEIRTEGRGRRDRDWREEHEERGVGIRLPGVGIELGR
jgi:hypothetical protein